MEKTPRQKNQEKWFDRAERFASMGITQSLFCETEGINKATFLYWLKKYRLSKQKLGEEVSGFVPLVGLNSELMAEQIVLRYGVVELSIPVTYQLDKLIPFIQSLSKPC